MARRRFEIPVEFEAPPCDTSTRYRLIEIEADLAGLISHQTGRRTTITRVAPAGPDAGIARTAWYAGVDGRPMLRLWCSPETTGAAFVLHVDTGASRQEGRGLMLLQQRRDALELHHAGACHFKYQYDTRRPDLPRPYFHPITGPSGDVLTQNGEYPGTERGHVHHTGLVIAHQNFTDGNNWQIGPERSRMRHLGFNLIESGPHAARFEQELEWLDQAGAQSLFREKRHLLATRSPDELRFDFMIELTCAGRPVIWKPTPYHLMAIRLPDGLSGAGGAAIVNSEGARGQATAGASARWLDISGRLSAPCGVTLLDHPENERHPAPWLNFEDETFGAAPGYHQPIEWAPGQQRRFRARFVFHRGEGAAAAERRWRDYAAPPRARFGPPRLLA